MITTIEDAPQNQTVHAHVVEEILPHELTEVTDVKDVISQFLPTRKRKPRAKKPTGGEYMPQTLTLSEFSIRYAICFSNSRS